MKKITDITCTFLLCFTVIAFGFTGCTDTVEPQSDTVSRVLSKAETIEYLQRTGKYTADNIYGYVILSSIKSTIMDFPTFVGLYEDTQGDFRDLPDTSAYSVDVGTVTLNNTIIPKYTYEQATTYGVVDFPVIADKIYLWKITGNNGYKDLTINCPAPVNKANITFPIQSDSISRSKDLKVVWVGSNEPNSVISISVAGNNNGKRYFVDDNGSLIIPASEMSKLGNGIGRLQIERNVFSIATITAGKYMMARIHSGHSLEFTLTE